MNRAEGDGKLIAIEGIDGCGKTSLSRALSQALEDENVAVTLARLPSDDAIGSLIREALSGRSRFDRRSFLFAFAADAVDAFTHINRWVNMGDVVVCDRHPLVSAAVFQVDDHSKENIARVGAVCEELGVCAADHLFVLDVPVEVSLGRMAKRVKYKDLIYETENVAKLEELRARYRQASQTFNGHVLDATRSIDELVEEVRQAACV